jgi:ATP10 protein
MPRYFTFALLIAGVSMFVPQLGVAQSNAPPLQVGDAFPQISGQTLTGKSLQLPDAAAGKPALVVFSFSRAAGKDARSWNEHLFKDFSNSKAIPVPGYQVIVLESVPKLFRSMAISGIKSNMPLAVQDRTIVSYQDEAIWKQHLAVSDENRAYIVLLGPDGHIRWRNSAAFTDSEYAHLKNELETPLQPHS